MPETSIQPAESAALDTYIDEANPTANYETATTLRLVLHNTGNNKDILLKFDLTEIEEGSTIEAAKLYLYLESQVGGVSGLGTCYISRILEGNSDWTEAGATWNTKDGSNAWAGSAGCETEGTDFSVIPMWSGQPSATTGQFSEFELDIAEFQRLLDVANYGFKLWSGVRSPIVDRSRVYTSASGATADNHPKLYVRWTEPAGRLVEYTFNVWDPRQQIIGRDGHPVQPNEIREDKWGQVVGWKSPSSKIYESLAKEPTMFYTDGVESDGVTARIVPDPNLFADLILKKLGGGG